jgi:hypothetical protein
MEMIASAAKACEESSSSRLALPAVPDHSTKAPAWVFVATFRALPVTIISSEESFSVRKSLKP